MQIFISLFTLSGQPFVTSCVDSIESFELQLASECHLLPFALSLYFLECITCQLLHLRTMHANLNWVTFSNQLNWSLNERFFFSSLSLFALAFELLDDADAPLSCCFFFSFALRFRQKINFLQSAFCCLLLESGNKLIHCLRGSTIEMIQLIQ